MAETAAEIEAQLAAVRAQMSAPKHSAFNQRAVTARDLAELVTLEALLQGKLDALTAPTVSRPRQHLLYQASSGF